VLDSVLQGTLQECDVYSYTPDIDSDPHAESSEDDDDDDDDELDGPGADGDDFLEGFEDDGYHSGGRRRSEGSRRGRRSNDGGGFDDGFDDDEGEFDPPSLNSLPLVGGRAKPPALNDTTRRGCLWCVLPSHLLDCSSSFSLRSSSPQVGQLLLRLAATETHPLLLDLGQEAGAQSLLANVVYGPADGAPDVFPVRRQQSERRAQGEAHDDGGGGRLARTERPRRAGRWRTTTACSHLCRQQGHQGLRTCHYPPSPPSRHAGRTDALTTS
jgi:hypothetical protein